MVTKIDILLWVIIGIMLVMFIFWKMYERRENKKKNAKNSVHMKKNMPE